MPATSSTVDQLMPAIASFCFFRSVKARIAPAAMATKLIGRCTTSTSTSTAAMRARVSFCTPVAAGAAGAVSVMGGATRVSTAVPVDAEPPVGAQPGSPVMGRRDGSAGAVVGVGAGGAVLQVSHPGQHGVAEHGQHRQQ